MTTPVTTPAFRQMKCINVLGAHNLTLNGMYTIDVTTLRDRPEGPCYYVVRDGGVKQLTLASRFVEVRDVRDVQLPWVPQTQAEPAKPAPAPVAKPANMLGAPPKKQLVFVCKCVICAKPLDEVLGLMSIAYPYTNVVATESPRTPSGHHPELLFACESCSRLIDAFIKSKKKVVTDAPYPDLEDLLA